MRKRQQRNLPGPAPVDVAEVMELVHGDAADIGGLPFAQRLVRQNLGGAAHHRSLGVDMRVAGDHADVVAAEHLHQIEELLVDERLDGRGVIRASSVASAMKCNPSATSDLPDPVGVPKMTWLPTARLIRASS